MFGGRQAARHQERLDALIDAPDENITSVCFRVDDARRIEFTSSVVPSQFDHRYTPMQMSHEYNLVARISNIVKRRALNTGRLLNSTDQYALSRNVFHD